MTLLKKIGIFIFMFLMLGSGIIVTGLALGVLTGDMLIWAVDAVSNYPSGRIVFMVIAALFFGVGCILPLIWLRKLEEKRNISFETADGEVTISLLAVEDYVQKVARNIPGIKGIRSKASSGRKGINISVGLSVSASADMPKMMEHIQAEVKDKIHEMIGMDGEINVKIHVNKIIRGNESVSQQNEENS